MRAKNNEKDSQNAKKNSHFHKLRVDFYDLMVEIQIFFLYLLSEYAKKLKQIHQIKKKV